MLVLMFCMSGSQLKLFMFLVARDSCSHICTSSAAWGLVRSFSELLWSAHYTDTWTSAWALGRQSEASVHGSPGINMKMPLSSNLTMCVWKPHNHIILHLFNSTYTSKFYRFDLVNTNAKCAQNLCRVDVWVTGSKTSHWLCMMRRF